MQVSGNGDRVKILFVSNLYPPNAIGGYERLCFDVAGELASRGHEITVLTSSYGDKVEDYMGQDISRMLKLLASEGNIYEPLACTSEERSAINTSNIDALNRLVSTVNPDIVFVWNMYFLDGSFLDAVRRLNKKTAYLLTDNWMISFLNASFIRRYFTERVFRNITLKKKIYLYIKKLVSGLELSRFPANSIAIFPSHFMEKLYLEAGVTFARSKVIYHGVRIKSEENRRFTDRRETVAGGEIRLLFAGRVVDVKGLHTVIEALPDIIENAGQEFRVCLTVVGDVQDQEYWGRIKGLVKQHSLEEHVAFNASVPENRLFELFQEYDIYIFPSLYEPFSLTLIHALGSGIPTVASDAGGNPEIVRDMVTGLLFEKGDPHALAVAVQKLVQSNQLRERISVAERQLASQYTFGRMVTKLEDVLKGSEWG